MSEVRTLEQERAASALRQVGTLAGERAEKYCRDATGFGPLVISNGLAGAVAFVQAKGGSNFLAHVNEWICRQFPSPNGTTVLDKVGDSSCDPATYRAITRECLEYANWLKRLSKARVRKQ